ncbi:ROK family transcriptional regulator [Candidatus Solirubrobacter pratensis]|uniref:ROK family transcriptional regulator n=1 Tax=Candidatus Solirubrobacter pratensis TaxID=1298857 RepID=UPI000400873C|nr:ROK family transcriptional regulator [Candidatus Solirubrobacter pratensis]
MPQGRAGSLESLRRLNRLRVIHALRDEGQISRAEIARRTGLSRSTVSSLVADLQADGLVVERPEPGSAHGAQGGRPPILLSFDASAGAAVGIDFGHSHLRVAVSDLASTILAERKLPLDTDHDAQQGLELAAEMVADALSDAGVQRTQVIGAGMGLPGPIEQSAGTVGSSAILPGWIGMMAASEMRRRLDIPVMVDNDANLGALAEAAFGAGQDAGDLIYLKVSSGIGAGLILNGRLYRGSSGLAGELGHVLVDPDGIVCRCGNRGCLETVAATGALVDLLRRSHGDELTVDAMLEAARGGDLGCRRVIHDAGRALGQVVATLLNVLNPELLVVGGDLAGAGDLLLDGMRESVGRAALPEAARRADVVGGVLGDRAQVLGALALVVSEADRTFPTRLVAS